MVKGLPCYGLVKMGDSLLAKCTWGHVMLEWDIGMHVARFSDALNHFLKTDTLGFEHKAVRLRNGCDTTTPCTRVTLRCAYILVECCRATGSNYTTVFVPSAIVVGNMVWGNGMLARHVATLNISPLPSCNRIGSNSSVRMLTQLPELLPMCEHVAPWLN